jgi:hypothetical protein
MRNKCVKPGARVSAVLPLGANQRIRRGHGATRNDAMSDAGSKCRWVDRLTRLTKMDAPSISKECCSGKTQVKEASIRRPAEYWLQPTTLPGLNCFSVPQL